MLLNLEFTHPHLHAAYANGCAPRDVVDEAYRRITAADDPGIFLCLRAIDAVKADADALPPFDPARFPLWGLPFAVKDNIDVAGLPTTAACPDFAYRAEHDAVVVARLRAAGALVIGKTNLDQFATGLVGTRTPYPVPRNALDADLVPGGSSSGSAVAVARALVTFALGTDTAGSGRVPAALNGIVGLKPTLGLLSATGLVPACRTLDTISVFAMTVEDAYAAFRVAAAPDPTDAYSRALPVVPLGPVPPAPRIGIPDANSRLFFGDCLQEKAFDAALARLSALGATLVEIDLAPFYEVARLLYDGPWVAERYAAIAEILRDRPDSLLPVTRGIIEGATRFSASDLFQAQYRLQAMKRAAAATMGSVDMLCVPTIPGPVTVVEDAADPLGPNARLGTYTNFVNLLDLCGLAVPCDRRDDGLPGSVTLLAEAGADHRIAAVARCLQGSTRPQSDTPETNPIPAPGPEEMAIAAVGAHMSGLPLNGELTRLGGRFLRQARTAPTYHLYRLAGGPPARPGLVKAADGAAIALEIWALPRTAVGAFLAGIPAPLGLGTVTLDTGEQVKGFICEPSGLDGAEDITTSGGWRAYLAGPQCTAQSLKEISNG